MIEQIGKYKILEKIGQGAMGEVYKAHDPVLNRFVAVKTISADLGADDMLRKRFQREAQSAARLNHPNIITVYDYGEEQGKIYMAMELLEGSDLKQAIAARALPDLAGRLAIMEQICDGLAFAHAHEIVHRDLKPANIHLLADGQVKIMDFGLARLGGSEMTRTGMVMGTPHYMSPEQVRGERADARSDVFALGCVFYELLTYRKPFDADSMHSVLFKVMQEEPPPVHDLAPGIPAVLAQVVERAMAKDATQRFQNAGEFRSALHRAMQAVAGGQGDKALPDLAKPAGAAPTRGAESSAMASASRSGAASRSGSTAGTTHAFGPWARASRAPAAPPASSKTPLIVGGAVVLAAIAGAGLFFHPSVAGGASRSARHPHLAGGRPGPGAGAVTGRAGQATRGRRRLPRRAAPVGARAQDRSRQQGRPGDPGHGQGDGGEGGRRRRRSAMPRRRETTSSGGRALDPHRDRAGARRRHRPRPEVRVRLPRPRRSGAAHHDGGASGRGAVQGGRGQRPLQGRRRARPPGRGRVRGGRFATAARFFVTAGERFERAGCTAR